MLESAYLDAQNKIQNFTTAELDEELAKTAATNETTEMLLCCYLAAMQDRGGYREFGYWSIYDYAKARFSFGERKTRYLVSLGRRIEELPQIREALASGKLGWCKASRIAAVATRDDEAAWVDSAISLSLNDLERRIKDGTDTLAATLHFPLTHELRVLWENVLEAYRLRAGAEISPLQAFEYMLAEAFAAYGYVKDDGESEDTVESEVEAEPIPVTGPIEAQEETPPKKDSPVFPWAEPIDTSYLNQGSLWQTEGDAEKAFGTSSDFVDVRQLVLERDGWRCRYPGCSARKNLEVHHVRFRSRGGPDEPWNLCVLCTFHHKLLHSGQIALKGRAPLELEWTPPKLMREVIERRRNNPALWKQELEIREWTLDPAPSSA